MRILMLTDSFHPHVGGSETAIHRLSDALVDLGHTVGIAVISRPECTNPSTKVAFWNVPSRIGGSDAKFIGKIRNLRKIIREFRPDVLNAHFMLESGYVGVKAGHAEGVPVVLTNRGKGLYNKPMVFLEKLLYPFWNRGACGADAFIATSQEMVDMARERYGLASVAISNGVDTENFHPSKDGSYLREKYGVGPKQRVLFCARRLVSKNGIEYIVRALPLIREKHDVVLWLASPLIREYERLKALTENLGVAPFVRFLGAVDHQELPYHFAAADTVVQPSIAEARSLACLEAMASGCAIVATATGGLKELITDGENGILIPSFQEGTTYAVEEINQEGVRNLASAVCRVLADEALRHRLREGARRMSLTCSWPEIARQTLAVYNEVTKPMPTAAVSENKAIYRDLHDEIITKRFNAPSPIRRFAHRSQYRIFAEAVPAGANVLDAGCGEGVLSVLLAKKGCTVTGIDLSEPNIEASKNYAALEGVADRTTFRTGDIERLPFPDKSFDVVVSSHVLEHVPDFLQGARELRRIAKTSVIIAIPTCLNPSAMVLLGGDKYWTFSRRTPYAFLVGLLLTVVALVTGKEGVNEGYAGREELVHIRRFPWRAKKSLESAGLRVRAYRGSSYIFPYFPFLLPLSRLLDRVAFWPMIRSMGYGVTFFCKPE